MSSKIEAWTFSRALCRGRTILAGGGAKFFRDLSVLVGGQIAAKLIGFLAFAYLARSLDPQAYGAVEFIVGFAGLFAMAIDCGLGTIGMRRAAAAPSERPQLAAQISLIRLSIALICVPVMIVSANAVSDAGVPDKLIWLYAASLVFLAWHQEWLLQSAALMAQVAFAQILRMSVFFFVIVLLVGDSGDALLVGWGEIAAVAAAATYSLYVQQHRIAPIRFLASAKTKDLIREAIPVGLSRGVWSAAQFAPLFLVGALLGGADTGLFASANRLVGALMTFSFVYHFNLYAALAPAAAQDPAAYAALLRKSFRVVGWITIGGALFVMLAAAPIVGLVFGARFTPAAPALEILIWSVPVTFLSGHMRWALILAHAELYLFLAQVGGLVAVLLLGMGLVPLWGNVGASLAAVAGSMAVWCGSYLVTSAKGITAPPFHLIAKPLTAAFILAAVVNICTLGPWRGAIIALLFYVVAAPMLDRLLVSDLIRLAQVRSAGAAG
jgi:O-antigen/teichoic acid export membrane protein